MPISGSPDALFVKDLRAGYTWGQDILQGVDLEVSPGTVATIVGPNGAGKSTIVKAMMGLLKITGGRIRLGGTDLTKASPRQRVMAGMAICPQGRNNFPSMTVRDNLRLAGSAVEKAGVDSRYEAVMAQLKVLRDLEHRFAETLSGGQQQLLELGMALMSSPLYLLADEPSLGLSPSNCQLILGELRSLADHGLAILLVEQNARQALKVSERAFVVVGGRVVFDDAASTLLDGDRLRRLVLS